ncbi:MAG: AAA family ATPase [Actinomycetota bacterium]
MTHGPGGPAPARPAGPGGGPDKPDRRLGTAVALAVALLLAAYAAVVVYSQPHVGGERVSYTAFLNLVRAGSVQSAEVLDVDSYVVGSYARPDGTSARFSTPLLKESRDTAVDLITRAEVPLTIDQQNGKRAAALFSFLLPTMVLAVLFLYLILSHRRGTGLFGISSGARRFAGTGEKVGFGDVAGQDDAVAELREVTDFLADPSRFAALGAVAPKGVLLAGPPGCGKTLLARAVAGEAQAAFFSLAASDLVEMYVGVGAARVRDLFVQAREAAPAIVFIDEIDSLGARRAGSALSGDSEREQTVNQILVELDGFAAGGAVVVMAATNRPDLLDPALVRPGRFDRLVNVTLPDRAGRRAVLELHARGKPLAPDLDFEAAAGLTQGFSGADLANVLNEAALLAARRRQPAVTMALVEEAVDRAVLGISSRGTVLTDGERRRVAWHEAGHAVLALALKGTAHVPHKLTIVPRGATLGRCVFAAGHDRVLESRSELADEMVVGLGGWLAEDLVFGEPSSAGSTDLARVGRLARRMVSELGMGQGGLGASVLATGDHAGDHAGGWAPSDEVRRRFDEEAMAVVEGARARAADLLARSRPALDRVAEALLARETLTLGELVELTSTTPLAEHRPRPAGGPAGGIEGEADRSTTAGPGR